MNKRNPELTDPYWLNINNGKLRLAAENPGIFTGYLADLTNQVRVATAISANGETEIHARNTEKEPWRLVKRYPIEDITSVLAFHQDRKRIYVKSSFGGNLSALCLLDLSSGEETVVHQDPLNESDLVNAIFDQRTHQLLAVQYEGNKVRSYGMTPEIERDLESIRNANPDNFYLGTATDDHSRWIVAYYSPTNPGQTFLYQREKAKLQLLEAWTR